jgi:CheY-like chemotaxis protein
MKRSVLKGKRLLAVDDEPDVLTLLEEEIADAGLHCQLDKATTFAEASRKLSSEGYDLAVLDIMGVNGFALLEIARSRNVPAVMLTAHALTPQALKRSIEMGARAYLPKDKLGELVPFLEDVLSHDSFPGWKRLFERLGKFFDLRFGVDWQKSEAEFWQEFSEKVGVEKWIVMR